MVASFFYWGHCSSGICSSRQMVNQHYYRKVLQCLREQVRQKLPEWWWNQNWFIHHDNSLAHTALSVHKVLADKSMAEVPYPPYSPDFAPCDFLLPRMKSTKRVSLKFKQSLTILHVIPKCQIQQWQNAGPVS
jgi:hypothetical protein